MTRRMKHFGMLGYCTLNYNIWPRDHCVDFFLLNDDYNELHQCVVSGVLCFSVKYVNEDIDCSQTQLICIIYFRYMFRSKRVISWPVV
jgi:hypothetical protein